MREHSGRSLPFFPAVLPSISCCFFNQFPKYWTLKSSVLLKDNYYFFFRSGVIVKPASGSLEPLRPRTSTSFGYLSENKLISDLELASRSICQSHMRGRCFLVEEHIEDNLKVIDNTLKIYWRQWALSLSDYIAPYDIPYSLTFAKHFCFGLSLSTWYLADVEIILCLMDLRLTELVVFHSLIRDRRHLLFQRKRYATCINLS